MALDGNIRAIGRGLKVLQVINLHGPVSMTTIAERCHLPYPTTCRIVETLLDEGMIERESTRKLYRPTALVRTLSAGAEHDDDLARISRQHIVSLTRDVHWPITLCTRVGMSMMIRDSTHTIAPYTLNIYHRGYTMPLLGSSSGKVCLAFSEGAEQRTFLTLIRQNNDAGERLAERLDKEFAEIRSNGYGSYDRLRHTANPGKTSAISVPILADGACKATLTLAFFCSALTLANAVGKFLPAMKRAADLIGDELTQERRMTA